MSEAVEIRVRGVDGVPMVEHLWEALFDHHLSIGAAGLQTIARGASWPRRRAHYETLFSERANARIWVAMLRGEAVGYAMAYEDELDGERAMILETLSMLPEVRGRGIGTRFMGAVDQTAREVGIVVGVVDVMGGNPRARELYLRQGYTPHSEAWLRSTPPKRPAGVAGSGLASIAAAADRLGLRFSTSPGPDDTWESADDIVELAVPTSATWLTSTITARLSAGNMKSAEGGSSFAELDEFFTLLESAGLWTIRFEIPARPAGRALRDFLTAEGFRMSTERLTRKP